MSKSKDQLEFMRDWPRYRPTGTVLAFCEPHVINEVLLFDSYRMRLTGEITREQFLASLRESRQHQHSVGAEFFVQGSKTDIDSAQDKEEPGPEYTHFYRAECI